MRRLLVLVALVAVVLAGCGSLRIETDDPAPAQPGQQEQERQRLAVESLLLARTAEHALATADGETAEVLTAVAADAHTHLEIVGGVWRPSGRHLSAVVPRGDADDVLSLLTAAAQHTREAAGEADGDLAPLLAGITVSRLMRADQLAVALGGEPGVVEPALPALLDPTTAADLVRTHDALGQAWEIIAARADGDERGDAADEARRWRTAAQDLAALAGVADTPEDPRLVSYELGTDLPAAVADLVGDLMPCWLAQVPSTAGEDRDRVIDLALDAGRDAGLGVPGAAVPTVPGLDV